MIKALLQILDTSRVGEVAAVAGSAVPAGWLPLHGQLLSSSEYPELYSAIGTQYGSGGAGTFRLPERRVFGAMPWMIFTGQEQTPVLEVPVIAAIHGPASGLYPAGAVLDFSVQLLDEVAMTGGPVHLAVDIGGIATLLAPSAVTATAWSFSYTVQTGDSGALTASLNLNGAVLSTVADGIPVALRANSLLGAVDIDGIAPTAPTLTQQGATGVIDVGGLEAGATWQYSVDNGATWTAGSGAAFTLTTGTHAVGTVQAKQTDAAGNIGAVGANGSAIIAP